MSGAEPSCESYVIAYVPVYVYVYVLECAHNRICCGGLYVDVLRMLNAFYKCVTRTECTNKSGNYTTKKKIIQKCMVQAVCWLRERESEESAQERTIYFISVSRLFMWWRGGGGGRD